jgi:hypothetical protein
MSGGQSTLPQFRQMIFFQVDLGGHSGWAAEHQSLPGAYRQRRNFADRLTTELKEKVSFSPVFWAGDGGLFAREFSKPIDAHAVCDAADIAFSVFSDCFKAESLSLRASATYIADVIVDKRSGYWFSLELNEFLKFERSFGFTNAFTITEKLHKLMEAEHSAFRRFPRESYMTVGLGENRTVVIFFDKDHPWQEEESLNRFSVWLDKKEYPRTGTGQMEGWKIDRSVVFGSALNDKGYEKIDLIPVEPTWKDKDIFGPLEDEWRELAHSYEFLGGSKASVKTILQPLTDDPVLRMRWRLIPFPLVKAFHDLCGKSDAFRHKYEEFATVQRDRRLPGILAAHCPVVLNKSDGRRLFVLAHRKKGEREGGYYDNCWSASFEEQFAPTLSSWGGREHPRDRSIYETVRRGLREEFLGENCRADIDIRFHALQIETPNLNMGVLAMVEIRDLSFPDFVRLWPTAVDAEEHDTLVALPFETSYLKRCLEADHLPVSEVSRELQCGLDGLSSNDHLWHPISHARLAMGLWLLEKEGSSGKS